MEPAMRLVILRQNRTAGVRGRDANRPVRRRLRPDSLVRRPARHWVFSLFVTATCLVVAACSTTISESGLPRPGVFQATHPGAVGPSTRGNALRVPRVASGFVSLAELVRGRIAAALAVDAERVTLAFDTPEASRMVLRDSFPLHLERLPAQQAWMVVFDSVPGSRPELRLSLRAEVRPATEPVRPRDER